MTQEQRTQDCIAGDALRKRIQGEMESPPVSNIIQVILPQRKTEPLKRQNGRVGILKLSTQQLNILAIPFSLKYYLEIQIS